MLRAGGMAQWRRARLVLFPELSSDEWQLPVIPTPGDSTSLASSGTCTHVHTHMQTCTSMELKIKRLKEC